MSNYNNPSHPESGFTLIEVMVVMVISLVILGGLLLNFTQQYSEYNYQSKRMNTVQNLEFSMRFMAEDLRAGLISLSGAPTGNPAENNAFAGTAATTGLTFWVWDESNGITSSRAQRKYLLSGSSLRYDPEASGADDTASVSNTVLTDITFFKVFLDGTTSRTGFSGIPAALGTLIVNDPSGTPQAVNGYTILIEMAVDAGYKGGSFLDVNSVDVRTTADQRKRVWRYIQVYPMTVVD
ncbi:MAG: prepilin-type N-terminal cleavage/methylation domain-containing protein [Mariprofundaceae bacterium]